MYATQAPAETDIGVFNAFPLDKILQMPATSAGEGLTGARSTDAPAVPEAPARARDSLRSRDREGRP